MADNSKNNDKNEKKVESKSERLKKRLRVAQERSRQLNMEYKQAVAEEKVKKYEPLALAFNEVFGKDSNLPHTEKGFVKYFKDLKGSADAYLQSGSRPENKQNNQAAKSN